MVCVCTKYLHVLLARISGLLSFSLHKSWRLSGSSIQLLRLFQSHSDALSTIQMSRRGSFPHEFHSNKTNGQQEDIRSTISRIDSTSNHLYQYCWTSLSQWISMSMNENGRRLSWLDLDGFSLSGFFWKGLHHFGNQQSIAWFKKSAVRRDDPIARIDSCKRLVPGSEFWY